MWRHRHRHQTTICHVSPRPMIDQRFLWTLETSAALMMRNQSSKTSRIPKICWKCRTQLRCNSCWHTKLVTCIGLKSNNAFPFWILPWRYFGRSCWHDDDDDDDDDDDEDDEDDGDDVSHSIVEPESEFVPEKTGTSRLTPFCLHSPDKMMIDLNFLLCSDDMQAENPPKLSTSRLIMLPYKHPAT